MKSKIAEHFPPPEVPDNPRALYNLGIDLRGFDGTRAITMSQARKIIRGRKGDASVETVRRWASPHTGCRPAGPDGPLLVLPAVRLNGLLYTMAEWVEAFERARQELGRRPVRERVSHRTPRQRRAAHRRAEAYLDRKGVVG